MAVRIFEPKKAIVFPISRELITPVKSPNKQVQFVFVLYWLHFLLNGRVKNLLCFERKKR